MRPYKPVIAMLAAAAAAAPAVSAAQPCETCRENIVYAACYLFSSGQPGNPSAYIETQKTTGWHMYNYFQSKTGERLLPGSGYYSIRCHRGKTAAEADAERIKSGYVQTSYIPWPKGFVPVPDPYDPRGNWAACLKSHASGTYVTPGFPSNAPDYLARLNADATKRWGSSEYVTCDYGATREDVDRKIRSHYTTAPRAWPLPWEAQQATAPPPKPAPTPSPKPAQTASLTVKTDTSAKDAAKAWDEQVKKTLAAEAQKKVETAAKQAQADARRQAEIAAFFAERRKQGRAQ